MREFSCDLQRMERFASGKCKREGETGQRRYILLGTRVVGLYTLYPTDRVQSRIHLKDKKLTPITESKRKPVLNEGPR